MSVGRQPVKHLPVLRLAMTVFALAFGAASAGAADLPSRLAPPIYTPPAAYSWTGFYIGVNAGYAYDHVPTYDHLFTPDATILGFSSHGLIERGAIAGGQIGYNSQLADIPYAGSFVHQVALASGSTVLKTVVDHVVVGVEFEGEYGDINGRINLQTGIGPVLLGTKIRDFGTLKLRVGYTIGPVWAYLFTGGAFATTENYYAAAGFSGTASITRVPLRLAKRPLGIGFDYAINNKWAVDLEYMYDYISAYNQAFKPAPGFSFNYISRTSFDSLRLAVNYKLDIFGAPTVVARY